MKVFVISDIHGHYSIMTSALNQKGFDPSNPAHHLLCLGDYFDRGHENTQVYSYLKTLHDQKKASFLLGNHDLFLLEFLEGNFTKARFNATHNGFDTTLEAFSGIPYDAQHHETIFNTIHQRFPKLKAWLASMPLFIETEHYIFTHGGIDQTLTNWRTQARETFVWNYQSTLPHHPEKTIIVGHERTWMIRMKRAINNANKPYDIIYDDHVKYIDSFVEQSKQMNVLILDENIL